LLSFFCSDSKERGVLLGGGELVQQGAEGAQRLHVQPSRQDRGPAPEAHHYRDKSRRYKLIFRFISKHKAFKDVFQPEKRRVKRGT
jgi:hypothetical protein